MFTMTFKKRFYIHTILLVVFVTTFMVANNIYDHWKAMIEKEFEKVEAIAILLDAHLQEDYNQLLDLKTDLSFEQRKLILNQKLQPVIDQITQAFPTYGAGYYSKELNSIIAFGPNFNQDELIDISTDSKARIVYETKQPYKFRDYSQTRDGQVVAIIHPLLRNGEVIGHVWGNIEINSVYTDFWAYFQDKILLIILLLLFSLFATYLILRQYTHSLKVFKERVQSLDNDETDMRLFSPDLLELYREVIHSRKLLSEKEKDIHKIVKQKIIQAEDRERKRVSQDLHDSVGQSLYSILVTSKLLNEMAKEDKLKNHIQNIEKMVSAAMEEVKNIALKLRPSTLDDLGLIPAIRSLIEKFQKSFGFEVDLQVCSHVKKRYSDTIEMYLYRICQEAFNNIAKYANAKKVYLSICDYEDKLEMVIRDEGNGFNVKEVNKERKGMGLIGMHERASLLNGEFTIESEVGKGTTIQVKIPLNDNVEQVG